jgi:DNA-binding NarL/FixJ family response regulator
MELKAPIGILLVHPVAVVRMGLASLLLAYPDLAVVGEASAAATAIRLSGKVQPDVVLLSHLSSDAHALRHLCTLRHEKNCRIVLIGDSFDEEWIIECAVAGVLSFVHCEAGLEEVVTAIRSAHNGCLAFTGEITRMMAHRMQASVGGPIRRRRRKPSVTRLLTAPTTARSGEVSGLDESSE